MVFFALPERTIFIYTKIYGQILRTNYTFHESLHDAYLNQSICVHGGT